MAPKKGVEGCPGSGLRRLFCSAEFGERAFRACAFECLEHGAPPLVDQVVVEVEIERGDVGDFGPYDGERGSRPVLEDGPPSLVTRSSPRSWRRSAP